MEQNSGKKSSAGQKILKCGVISWIVIIAVWALGAMSIKDEYFLPSPKQTLISIKLLIENGTLWADIAASAGRVIKGWLLAIVFAVPLGLLVGNFRVVRWLRNCKVPDSRCSLGTNLSILSFFFQKLLRSILQLPFYPIVSNCSLSVSSHWHELPIAHFPPWSLQHFQCYEYLLL